jgi:hypothetical protein
MTSVGVVVFAVGTGGVVIVVAVAVVLVVLLATVSMRGRQMRGATAWWGAARPRPGTRDNLQRAHNENPIFHTVPTLSLADGIRAVRLKLYDEQGHRMVTFAQASAHGRATPRPRVDDGVGTARTAQQPTT